MTGFKYSKYGKYGGEYFKIAGEIGNAGAMRTNQSCAGVSSRMATVIVTILKVELLSDKSIPTPNHSLILTANHDLLEVRKGGGGGS